MAISAATAATITAITAVASAAVATYGQLQQSAITSANAKREADAKRMQAQLAEDNSRLAAAEKQKEQQRTASSQVVSGAAAGVSLNSASLLDLMDETSSLYEKDRQQLLLTGRLQSEGLNYGAAGFEASAKRGPSYFGAGATMLNGIGTGTSYFGAGATKLNGIGTGLSYSNKAGWFDK